jgi:hypothetical protein
MHTRIGGTAAGKDCSRQEHLGQPEQYSINQDTFEYVTADYDAVGGFSWNLMYEWINIDDDVLNKKCNQEESIPTPNLPGGNFAINKEFFKLLGQQGR